MKYFAFAVLIILVSGCAYIRTEKANLNETPNGIRVYPPRLHLAVDTDAKQSTLFYAPDMKNAYDIKPISVLAKHDFQVDIEEGQVKSVKSNQDPTSFLTFFKDVGALAAKAAGFPVSAQNITGTFGLKTGIYVLDDQGVFVPLNSSRPQSR